MMAIVNFQWRKDVLKALREHPDTWELHVRAMHEHVPADLEEMIRHVKRSLHDNDERKKS